jgi:cation transport ATPase
MATKKQRRRRAKAQRHEYVWVDADGNELDPEEVPAAKSESKPSTARAGRPAREQQAPSWQRTFKRALIFAPIMFATVFLLSPDLPMTTKVMQTLLIVAIFVPFSYFLDRVFYRSFQRRQARSGSAGRGS